MTAEKPPVGKKTPILGMIVAALVVLVLIFCGVVALQPDEYRVVRSAQIAAPPPAVFNQINDFHNWDLWSPWAKLDPMAKNGFEGPSAGTGAIFTWAGNKEVGQGRMTITESRPSDLIRIQLEFIKPVPSVCTTEFVFKPEGDQTGVTWSMNGRNGFVAKAFCLFMDMDKMVGGDFERGLANLKSVTEMAAKQ